MRISIALVSLFLFGCGSEPLPAIVVNPYVGCFNCTESDLTGSFSCGMWDRDDSRNPCPNVDFKCSYRCQTTEGAGQ